MAEALLHRGFRVALPEPRGIAPSSGPMHGLTFIDLASDMADVIRAEAPRDGAIVAGHAYGAWIARCLGQSFPDLVNGLAFLAAGARAWPAHLSDAISAINNPETSDEDRRAALGLAFFAKGNDPADWMSGWHPEVVAMQREARAGTDPADWRPAGTAPILDLRGAEDPFRPKGTENDVEEELGPRVTAEVLPGTSHALPAERPEKAAEILARWAKTCLRTTR